MSRHDFKNSFSSIDRNQTNFSTLTLLKIFSQPLLIPLYQKNVRSWIGTFRQKAPLDGFCDKPSLSHTQSSTFQSNSKWSASSRFFFTWPTFSFFRLEPSFAYRLLHSSPMYLTHTLLSPILTRQITRCLYPIVSNEKMTVPGPIELHSWQYLLSSLPGGRLLSRSNVPIVKPVQEDSTIMERKKIFHDLFALICAEIILYPLLTCYHRIIIYDDFDVLRMNDVVQQTWSYDGLSGFYGGLATRIFRILVGFAVEVYAKSAMNHPNDRIMFEPLLVGTMYFTQPFWKISVIQQSQSIKPGLCHSSWTLSDIVKSFSWMGFCVRGLWLTTFLYLNTQILSEFIKSIENV